MGAGVKLQMSESWAMCSLPVPLGAQHVNSAWKNPGEVIQEDDEEERPCGQRNNMGKGTEAQNLQAAWRVGCKVGTGG